MNDYYVYMMTNEANTVLYTGITSNLVKRVFEHRSGAIEGFTLKYRLKKLVYFEVCQDVNAAISREKQIKGWLRKKKDALVQKHNAEWKDLYDVII